MLLSIRSLRLQELTAIDEAGDGSVAGFIPVLCQIIME